MTNEPASRSQTTIEHETKDNVVDWDGPDDPQNPRNWPAWKRMTQVILAIHLLAHCVRQFLCSPQAKAIGTD